MVDVTVLRQAKLSRLLQIVVALQSNGRPNARKLADTCEVSRRTIYRDLDAIEAAGITIEYDTARQGYRIGKAAAVGQPSLDEREALALLVLARQWQGSDPLGLLKQARTGVVKLLQALPDEARARVERCSALMENDLPLLAQSPPRQQIYDRMLDALAAGFQVRLTYRNPEQDGEETTKVAPYRLLLGRFGWSLIGRSSLHRRVRIFSMAFVTEVVATEDRAVVPPRFQADRWLQRTWAGEPGTETHEIRLRFSPILAPMISEGRWHPSQRLEPLPDGRLDLCLTLDRLDEVVGWVLGHGELVEVICPEELRRRIRKAALRVARRNAGQDRKASKGASPPRRNPLNIGGNPDSTGVAS